MLPYFDENPKQRIPYFTFFLVAVNIVLFFILNFRPDFENIILRFGFIPGQFSLLTMFTSIFLHASFFHLIGNMWFLWLFGDNIEDKIGTGLFILFYLLGGVFASLGHILLSSPTLAEIPCIGASGAISAVMGAYFMLFPKAKVRTIFFLYFMAIKVKISAYTFLGIWFLLQVLYGTITSSFLGGSNVAYGAHVGGFLFGILGGALIKSLLFKSDTLLMPQELKEKEEEKEFDKIVQKATEVKKEKTKGFKEFEEEITKFFEEGNIEKAIESYALFERYSIPGALKPKYQSRIADILNQRGNNLLALQAYSRLISQYSDHECSAAAFCHLGILYIRAFKDATEGFEYLNKGLKRADEISDKTLITEAKKEVNRINKALKVIFMASAKEKGQFCVLAQLFDEALWNSDEITKILRSIGMRDGKNIGMKLAYNADHNLKKKDGIILQKVNREEAFEAAKLIQSIGTPVVAVAQKTILEYPLIRDIRKVSLQKDKISFVGENSKNYEIAVSNILYICLSQLPYFIYGMSESGDGEDDIMGDLSYITALTNLGAWNLLARGKKEGKVKDLRFNRLLDIFTNNGLRLRISDLNFEYEAEDKLKSAEVDRFAFMVEDMASLVGGDKVDQSLELFISTSKWDSTYYRNVQELNHKGLWKMRLHLIYEDLLKRIN